MSLANNYVLTARSSSPISGKAIIQSEASSGRLGSRRHHPEGEVDSLRLIFIWSSVGTPLSSAFTLIKYAGNYETLVRTYICM